MKRTISLFLAIIMCAAAFAGCGDDKTTDGQQGSTAGSGQGTEGTQDTDPNGDAGTSPDTKPDDTHTTPEIPATPDTPATPDEPEKPEIMAPIEIPENGITVNGEFYSPEALAMIAAGDAYVNRGKWIQYDDSRLVAGSVAPSPIYRWSHGNNGVQDPENSSELHTLYTNCAAFIHTLYKEAFDFDLGSWTTAQFIERSDMIVYKYNVTGDEDSIKRQTICNQVWELLQPGDLIVYRYGDEKNGHIMAYVGGDMLVHSTAPGGGSFNYTTPKENAEATGSIQYMEVTKLFRESYSRYLFKLSRFAVLRPLQAFKGQIKITEETRNRMQYMQGVVAQLYSTHPYGVSANVRGDEITYTVKLENKNELAIEAAVEISFDKKAQYVSGADRFDGERAFFETIVPAKSTKELKYTVTASSDAKAGDKLTCGVVTVNGVQLKCPDITLKNTLTADQQELISKAASAYAGNRTGAAAVINGIYSDALGVQLNLKDEQTMLESVFDFYGGGETHLIINRSAEFFDLIVDAVYGGRQVVNCQSLTKRTSVVTPTMLLPGDVLIAAADVKGASCTVYMMLGDNRLMEVDHSGGARILLSNETEDLLMKLLAKHAFVLLRPSFGM